MRETCFFLLCLAADFGQSWSEDVYLMVEGPASISPALDSLKCPVVLRSLFFHPTYSIFSFTFYTINSNFSLSSSSSPFFLHYHFLFCLFYLLFFFNSHILFLLFFLFPFFHLVGAMKRG